MEIIKLSEGVTLRCFQDNRFKQGVLSVQLVRPMCREEAALNALLPAVLLRGTQKNPDLRQITARLDDLYGASMGALVRRVGDYQTTGLHCGFIDDKFALNGDEIFAPMVDFLEEVLFSPLLEKGVFSSNFVESEKKNLIATLDGEMNDKRVYASLQLMRNMCREDSFGIPRLGDRQAVGEITPESLYHHYIKILRESRVELFYVGSGETDAVAKKLAGIFKDRARKPQHLPEQTAFTGSPAGDITQKMEISQGKLAMGYVTPITLRGEDFAAMQMCNTILGGGMTSKLFSRVREELSLCYDIGSGYHGSKGIVVISAGIDSRMRQTVEKEVEEAIGAMARGEISGTEMENARQALISALASTHDTPGSIENYYATSALSGLKLTPETYMEKVSAITASQVAQAAATLKKHTVYFLEGVQE